LGVRPVVGRFFSRDEDSPPTGQHVAVVSERFWRTELGGDVSAIGRRITISGTAYTVVGVAPRGFTGVERRATDVWIPMSLTNPTSDWPTTYQAQWMRVVVRLKRGVDSRTANAEITTLLRGAYTGNDASMRQLVASVRPIWYARNGQPTPIVNVSRWLMGVAAIVLLITCANVVNLMLARTRRRSREVAVRLALGAGGARVVRFVLVEVLVLAFCGVALATVVAVAGGRVMRATLLDGVAWDEGVIDVRVLLFSLVVSVIVAMLVGLAPGLDASRVSITPALKAGEQGRGGARTRLRLSLAVLQAALCVVLLVGAGLFLQSLANSRNVDLGFQADRVVRVLPRFTAIGDLPQADADAAR
ncbi:MAG: ABC transporter permease, partial [Solirubrobacteraceae bacterium]